MPPKERQYWHPHNGEILSGQLVAPGIPAVAEHELMKSKMNSYGKTWHTWKSGHGTAPAQAAATARPMLAWSFNREGEAQPGLVEARDRRMGIDTARSAAARAGPAPAGPAAGRRGRAERPFGRPTQPIPGVEAAR